MKWISVKDRMPEDNKYVLILGTTEFGYKFLYSLAKYRDNMLGWHIIYDELGALIDSDSAWSFLPENITHWMELPPPPKE